MNQVYKVAIKEDGFYSSIWVKPPYLKKYVLGQYERATEKSLLFCFLDLNLARRYSVNTRGSILLCFTEDDPVSLPYFLEGRDFDLVFRDYWNKFKKSSRLLLEGDEVDSERFLWSQVSSSNSGN